MSFTHVQIATAVALIVGYFAAHAAGLLTKAHAPQWTLGIVTTILATLAGVLPTVVWNEHDRWTVYLLNVLAALFAATMAHRSQVPELIQVATHNFGVGGPAVPAGHTHADAGESIYGFLAAVGVALVVMLIIWFAVRAFA